MHTEKKINSELKFKGNVVEMYFDTVLLENGKEATRDVVRHKGAVCVAPMNDKGELIFVRQYRYALGRELLELPAGKYDSVGESPLDCCKRELEEETGCLADTIISMGSFISAPGFCDEKIELFFATGLTQKVAHPDEDEFLDVVKIPLEKAVQMIVSGEIEDGKTQALVLKCAKYIKTKNAVH